MTDAVGAAPQELLRGAGTGRWTLDPTRSSVSLRHKTMWNLVTVKGSFTTLAGEGEISADGSVTGRLELPVEALTTKNKKRDQHLRSDDFFDSANHPAIVFTVRRVTPKGADVAVTGELTVAGKTRPLAFTAAVTHSSPEAVILAADVDVDRADFGITWNQLGMMKGPASVSVIACLTHDA